MLRCPSTPHALARALDAPPPQFLATDAFGVVSWVIHKRQHAAPLVGTPKFDALWGAHPDTFLTFRPPGKSELVSYPRWTQAYGATYGFAGQVAHALPLNAAPAIVGEAAREWTDWLAAHRREGDDGVVSPLNGVLVNWYDGARGHYIGRHADDERQLVERAPIVSILYGAARRFWLTRKRKDWSKRDKVVFTLGDGDALVMGGALQQTHKHEIMKLTAREPTGQRRLSTAQTPHRSEHPTATTATLARRHTRRDQRRAKSRGWVAPPRLRKLKLDRRISHARSPPMWPVFLCKVCHRAVPRYANGCVKKPPREACPFEPTRVVVSTSHYERLLVLLARPAHARYAMQK